MTPADIALLSRPSVIASGPPATDLAKHWKLNTGLTQAGGFASAWADQIASTSLAQASGTSQPAVQGDGSLLFDGSNDAMTATFTLNQPCSIYLRTMVVTYASGRYLVSGGTNYSTIYMNGTTPTIMAYAGSNSAGNNDMTVGAKKSVGAVFNGASSVLQVSGGAATTGNFGAINAGGITLANIQGGTTSAGNVQIYEVLVYTVAHDSTQRAAVFAYLDTVSP